MYSKDGELMKMGIRAYAEEMERLRQVHAYEERVPVTLEWLIAEAYRQLEGLAHAIQAGATEAIILKVAADVGNLCQRIAERYVEPQLM
jgi:hypothetical protein